MDDRYVRQLEFYSRTHFGTDLSADELSDSSCAKAKVKLDEKAKTRKLSHIMSFSLLRTPLKHTNKALINNERDTFKVFKNDPS